MSDERGESARALPIDESVKSFSALDDLIPLSLTGNAVKVESDRFELIA
jgi:hypothetical protein